MGSVYLARHPDQQQLVALKIVRPEVDDPEIGDRFRREREILAALDHPNIARYLDGGTTESGSPYLVMEYVEGEALDQYCDSRELDLAARLRLFESLCAAVHYLHMHGVVHRDLKPSNILVTADGVVKLLDFGIAKLLKPAAGVRAQMTRSGLRLMTPEYASPEQVRGDAITPLSDVYALGVVLYELLTGHRPYRLQSRIFHEIVRAICEEPPTRPSTAVGQTVRQGDIDVTPDQVSRKRRTSPEQLERELAGDLDAILLRAMAKDPRQRYWSADQFCEDIRAHRNKEPVLAEGRQEWIDRATGLLQRNLAWLLAAVTLLLLWWTGSITIHRSAWLIAATAVLFLTVWKVCTHPVLGRRLAASAWLRPFSLAPLFVSYLAAKSILSASIGWMAADRDTQGISDPSAREVAFQSFARLLDNFDGVVAVLLIGVVLLNLNRRRWAGETLLRIPLQSGCLGLFLMGFGLMLFLEVPYLIIRMLQGKAMLHQVPGSALRTLFGAVVFYWAWKLLGMLEVRRRGLVCQGAYRRWVDIKDYHWAPSKWDADYRVLHLEIAGRLPITPPVRIEMWKGEADAVDAILQTMLRPWPAPGNADDAQASA